MGIIAKIKGHFVASLYSTSRVISSAGQTFFALQHVANYLFTNSSRYKLLIPITAIVGGFGVNMMTRVPANYKKFVYRCSDEFTQSPAENLSKSGFLLSHLLQMSGYTSCFFNGLTAYLGTIVLSETIAANLFQSDIHDEPWKEIVFQSLSLLVAISTMATYLSYDFQVTKKNAEAIAKNICARQFHLNRHTVKTLIAASFNLIASPILAKFWTTPALLKIPYASKYINNPTGQCITWASSISSLTNSILSLPSIYAYFNSEPLEYKGTRLTKSFQRSAYFFGTIDSIAAGSCIFIGIIDTGQKALQLNPYGHIVYFALPCGVSGAIQNMMFSVRPGCLELIKDKTPQQPETMPLLIEADSEDVSKNNSHDDEPSPDINSSKLHEENDSMMQEKFYSNASQVGLLFSPACHVINESLLNENLESLSTAQLAIRVCS